MGLRPSRCIEHRIKGLCEGRNETEVSRCGLLLIRAKDNLRFTEEIQACYAGETAVV